MLHQVRAACRRVATAATLVRLDEEALAVLAGTLAAELKAGPDPEAGPDPWAVDQERPAEERAALVLILATVAFGSGWHPLLIKPDGLSGARTIATALRRWAAAEALTAERLATISAAEIHERFGQPAGGERSVLMRLYALALVGLGTHVRDRHDGSFLGLVDAAGGRASGMVTLLDRLPCYRDVGEHGGQLVPFYKRAQLAAADLDRTLGVFADIGDLTAFADNLVPHVLRVDGVLRYDPDLAATIDAGERVRAGSAAEVEIRAGGVHAVELLRDALAERGVTMTAADLDGLLWRRGGRARYKAVPRHRTFTVAY